MKYDEYLNLFDTILKSDSPKAPYDDAEYFNYTKLNDSRMKRWNKTASLTDEMIEALTNLKQKQHWIIIAEPWCGDASQIVPFLVKMAEQSPAITYEIQLRDSEPFLIDSYLTNGGKAIPKMVSRDENGNDLFVWGPRPKGAQDLMIASKAKEIPMEQIKIDLQNWYNTNKGVAIQDEFLTFFFN
ncbi:MAG: thioredoxin family protein [Crocinitomicaceae bacterium]|nr:thioredoxin family protein [Crocinitomicaceae bacterium]